MQVMKPGDKAPDFSLPDQDGNLFNLYENLGAAGAVVFFYPKDNSQVCTAEVCAFRDNFSSFESKNVLVVGISNDNQESHRKFIRNNQLNFKLLSDIGGKVRSLWQVPKSIGIIPGRVTYVLDQMGVIKGIHSDMLRAETHVLEALKLLD